MEDFEQKIQQWRKEDHERKQRFDELCKKERELDREILTSISNLVQTIQEFKEASKSSVAPQSVEEKHEQKLVLENFSLQSSDEASSVASQVFDAKLETKLEQPGLQVNVQRALKQSALQKQATAVEVFKLQMEKKSVARVKMKCPNTQSRTGKHQFNMWFLSQPFQVH